MYILKIPLWSKIGSLICYNCCSRKTFKNNISSSNVVFLFPRVMGSLCLTLIRCQVLAIFILNVRSFKQIHVILEFKMYLLSPWPWLNLKWMLVRPFWKLMDASVRPFWKLFPWRGFSNVNIFHNKYKNRTQPYFMSFLYPMAGRNSSLQRK